MGGKAKKKLEKVVFFFHILVPCFAVIAIKSRKHSFKATACCCQYARRDNDKYVSGKCVRLSEDKKISQILQQKQKPAQDDGRDDHHLTNSYDPEVINQSIMIIRPEVEN